MRTVKIMALFVVSALLSIAASATVVAKGHEASDEVVTNPDDGTEIAITVFRPASASPSSPVPVVLHSHGWAGSRTATIGGAVEAFLDAGIGVVSIDQRGHGESGGQANVQDPTKETEDIKAVIDFIAKLSWVRHDRDATGKEIANDPVLGAIGGSYGGGYQTMTALDETAEEGHTRFNALAPEITWFDLPESLAPQKVIRTAWNVVLYAAGAGMVPDYIHEAFAWGSSTSQWPDGTLYGQRNDSIPNLDKEFHKHSPVWFVERGIRIDVPILFRQGISDNLFNLNQGLKIFDEAVTSDARRQSLFVGYNGGHALPNALPRGTSSGTIATEGDACSPDGDFTTLAIEFYKAVFAGRSTQGLLPARYNLTTSDDSDCLHYANLPTAKASALKPLGLDQIVIPVGSGAPLQFPLTDKPVTVAGVPVLSGKVTSAALDARVFFGLSMGTSPADAEVLTNNLMPLRRVLPVQDDKFSIELPGVAAQVPEGMSLFLTVTPVSDMSFGSGSRAPGGVVLSGLKLALPTAKG